MSYDSLLTDAEWASAEAEEWKRKVESARRDEQLVTFQPLPAEYSWLHVDAGTDRLLVDLANRPSSLGII